MQLKESNRTVHLTHGLICYLSTFFRQSFNQKHKQSSNVSLSGVQKRLIANDAIKPKFLSTQSNLKLSLTHLPAQIEITHHNKEFLNRLVTATMRLVFHSVTSNTRTNTVRGYSTFSVSC